MEDHMKKFLSLLFLMTVACSMDDARYLFLSSTLQPEDVLGEWFSTGKPYPALVGGGVVVVSDTVIWKLQREGTFIYDSIFYIRETHYGNGNPGPQQYGSVMYVEGQNTDELNYGTLIFRMPCYDSLWISNSGLWEYLARKH
jgi:hypothetical protein